MEIEIIGLILSVLSYAVLLGCVLLLTRHITKLQDQLGEIIMEYKMYQAAANNDYKTAGILRNIVAGGKNNSTPPEPLGKKDSTPPETIITQAG